MDKKSILKVSLITAGALVIPTALAVGIGVGYATASPKPAEYESMESYKVFNDFIQKTRARLASNSFSFKEESLVTEKTTVKNRKNQDVPVTYYYGIKLPEGKKLTSEVLQPKYPLSDNEDLKDEDLILGSYRAYEVIKQKVKDLGYENNDPQFITYPTQNIRSTTNGEFSEAADTEITLLGKKSITTFKETGEFEPTVKQMTENLKKDGFITQGFLFSTSKTNANNIGNNLIVTINPTNAAKSTAKDFYLVSHYDSTNTTGPKGLSWGATDNASGVSVSLRILEHYAKPENRETLGVRLHVMFVDGEELGKLGSEAFVKQFLTSKQENSNETNEMLKNSIGMINMDTVAGGDRMYIHSPDSSNAAIGNVSTIIRDQINAVSRIRSINLNDITQELEIHPMFTHDEFKPGETGDWSDHAPFYLKAKIPAAYIESTNFSLKSHSGKYDGYAQTDNPKAWVLKDGSTVELIPRQLNGGVITLKDFPGERKTYAIGGDIWHSDLDTPKWVNENVGTTFYRQLDTVFETLKAYFTSMYQIEKNEFKYFI